MSQYIEKKQRVVIESFCVFPRSINLTVVIICLVVNFNFLPLFCNASLLPLFISLFLFFLMGLLLLITFIFILLLMLTPSLLFSRGLVLVMLPVYFYKCGSQHKVKTT